MEVLKKKNSDNKNATVEIKNSFAAQKMEVAPLLLPDPGLPGLSGSRSQIA